MVCILAAIIKQPESSSRLFLVNHQLQNSNLNCIPKNVNFFCVLSKLSNLHGFGIAQEKWKNNQFPANFSLSGCPERGVIIEDNVSKTKCAFWVIAVLETSKNWWKMSAIAYIFSNSLPNFFFEFFEI